MKKILLIHFIFFLVAATTQVWAQSTLTAVSRSYTGSSAQFFYSFDTNPEYTIIHKEKRVDLRFTNTTLTKGLTLPSADDKMVKILSLPQKKDTTISIFFRYPPQKFKVLPGNEAHELILEILLGNEFSITRPSLAEKLQGVTQIQRTTKDFSNPINQSPYPGNWKKFIKEYEAPPVIDLPVQFSLPPFPAINLLSSTQEETSPLLPPEILEGSRSRQWLDLFPLITDLLNAEQEPEKKKKLALTSAEILFRSGKYQDAYEQFFQLARENGNQPVGQLAQYLLLLLQAQHADPYIADFELKSLEGAIDATNALQPWLRLTRIETALATKQIEAMGKLLAQDGIAFPAAATPYKSLRQADYWMASNELIKAHAAYQLLDKSSFLAEDSSTLSRYCHVLYHHKQYEQAMACYDRLAAHPEPNVTARLAMISFRRAMSSLHISPDTKLVNDFAEIETTYPNSDAGFLATLKQIDLKLLTLKNWEKPALSHYEDLAANTSDKRQLHEEVTLKIAILHHLLNDDEKCAEHLMQFLRDSRSSSLYETAQALLIEILPGLLKKYVQDGKPIEALVLAKQNRSLFVKNWIDISLLTDMAEAYSQLGFFNEALKLYIYLLDVSPQSEKASYYLPLITLAFEQGEYETVAEYSEEYAATYPKGQDFEKILFLRINNLLTRNKYQEALALLSANKPKDPQFTLVEATLHFHLNQYAKAKAILEKMDLHDKTRQDALFMLAESAFQLDNISLAESSFSPLQEGSGHKDQATYRLAEIARRNNQKDLALKLFKQVAEKGDNPYWKQLAKKEITLISFETKK